MSALMDKQVRFVWMVGLLIQWAYANGYTLTMGDGYRDARVPYGHPRSLHKHRLAHDFNVFKDGIYLDGTGQYQDMGEFWESIGGHWGGRFGDDNHFSLAHNGMA